jgi:hypothetical protein
MLLDFNLEELVNTPWFAMLQQRPSKSRKNKQFRLFICPSFQFSSENTSFSKHFNVVVQIIFLSSLES